MKKLLRSLTHHDALFLVLLFVVGAAILMAVLFAVYTQGATQESSLAQLTMRNRLLQLELLKLLDDFEAGIAAVGEGVSDDVANPTEAVLQSARSIWSPASDRSLFVVGKDRSIGWSIHDGTTVAIAGMPEPSTDPRGEGGGRLTVCSTDDAATVGLCILYPVSSATLVILADLGRVFDALETIAPVTAEAILIDYGGNEIARIDASDTKNGRFEIQGCDQIAESIANRIPASSSSALVLCDPAERRPYLGILNQYLGRVERPATVLVDDMVHSIVPIEQLGAYLALVEPMPSAPIGGDYSLTAIVLIGLVLYGVIIWLFASFRRTLFVQTRSVADLSAQKDVLFSLLSHNLKNNLAAISAHAHSGGADGEFRQRLQLSVDEASRVISDSLYFLQIREQRFDTPSCERIDAREIAEFLSLRCELCAEAEGTKLHIALPATPVPVFTNLNLALEALERLVHAAVEASSESVTIAVSPDLAAIDLTLVGDGLSENQLDLLDGGAPIAEYEPTRGQDMSVISLSVCRELLASIGSEICTSDGELDPRHFVVRFPAL